MMITALRLAFCLALLESLVGTANAVSLVRAPYVQNATADSMTIRWMTDVPAQSHVSFGSAVGSLTTTVVDATLVNHHEVVLTGLSSQTRYYYQVSDEFGPLAGNDADHYFETHPAPGTSLPVRIWVLGDSGGCGDDPAVCPVVLANKAAYLGFVAAEKADMLLFLGDNAYSSGTEEEYTRGLFDMFPDVLRNTPSWSAIGNHDYVSIVDGEGPYFDAFTHPTLGEGGGNPSGKEVYFSFDRGDVHFISLKYLRLTPSMYDWLEQDLLQNDATFTIVFIHVSPYSKGSHDSDTLGYAIDLRATILPLLEDHGVDLVLTGHSHGYERSFLIDGHYGDSSTCAAGECFLDGGDGNPTGGSGGYTKPEVGPTPHQGTIYAVVGNGSKSWTDAQMGDHPVMATRVGEVGSMVIEINGLQLDAYMVDQYGVVRDQFRLTKGVGATPLPAIDLGGWAPWLLVLLLAASGLSVGLGPRGITHASPGSPGDLAGS